MASDPFGFIVMIFKFINFLIDGFFKLLSMILNIEDFLMCPIRLFTHFDMCLYYWFLDTLMIIFHFFIKWAICAWFIWLPCWIVLTTFQICLYYYIPGIWKLKLTVDMCSPSKDTLSFIIEFMNVSLGKKKYILNRTGSDLSTCYCIYPIKMCFNPYTRYRNWFGDNNLGEASGDFILGLVILALLVIPHILYGKNKKSQNT